MVLSALRPSLSSAVLALQSLSDSYVFFGYVDQLLLGEGLTRDGVIPVLDYCMPEKECAGSGGEDPCELFGSIAFPVNEFFPPNTVEMPGDYEGTKQYCGCGR